MTEKLRELLEDVQTVYEGKGMVVHPNSFDKLRMEVIKLDNINRQQGEQIEKMKCCGNCKNEGDYKEPYRYGTGWCNICNRHKVAKGNFDKWEIKEK